MLESGATPEGSHLNSDSHRSLARVTITMRRSASEELHRLFEGTVAEAFQNERGIIQPGLIDYITDILDRNVSAERLSQLRGEGKVAQQDFMRSIPNQLGLMLRCCNELEMQAVPSRGLLADLYTGVGDYVLFYSGVFPESQIGRALDLYATQIPDRISSVAELGESAYRRATVLFEEKQLYQISSQDEEKEQGRVRAVEFLSDNFKVCVEGLRSVRDHLFHLIGERMHRWLILGS